MGSARRVGGRVALLLIGASALHGCIASSSNQMAEVRTTAKPSPAGVAALSVGENPYGGSGAGPIVSAPPSPEPAPPAAHQAAVAAPQAPSKPSAAALPSGDGPKRLLGLDSSAVEGLLGSPWLVRREASAELWQYRAANCVLDLFLYGKPGDLRVAHADLRARRENRAPLPACFTEIVNGGGQKAEAVKG